MPRLRTVGWAVGMPAAIVAAPLAVAFVDAELQSWSPPPSLVAAHQQYTTLLRRDALSAVARMAPASPGVHVVITDTTKVAREMAAELSAAADSLAPIIGSAQFVGAATFGVSGAAFLAVDSSRSGFRARRLGVQLPRRDGEPCITLVTLGNWVTGRTDDPDLARLRREWAMHQLVNSPCLLVGRFGRPAPAIARELDERRWMPALRGDYWTANSPRITQSAAPGELTELLFGTGLGSPVSRRRLLPCAEGQPSACAAQVLAMVAPANDAINPWAARWGQVADLSSAATGQLSGSSLSPWLRVPVIRDDGTVNDDAVVEGPRASRLVADMAISLGTERFARVWQTDQPLPAAYASIAGEPFEQFIMRWINAPATPRRALRGAQLPWTDAAWVLAMLATMLAICMRLASRREAR